MTDQQRADVLEGAVVYITHLRFYNDWLLTSHEAKQLWPGVQPTAKGGVTLAQIEWEDGRTARGSARCSARDNFCKAVGRQIATGRALKQALLAAS